MKAHMGRERKTWWRQVDNTTMRHNEHKQLGDIHLGLWPQADGFPLATLGLRLGSNLPIEGAKGLGHSSSFHNVDILPVREQIPSGHQAATRCMEVQTSVVRTLGVQGKVCMPRCDSRSSLKTF